MQAPGAVTVRYLCRDENPGTAPFESTAPTDTTPRQTPGSSTGLPFSPELPDAATTIAPLLIARVIAACSSSGQGTLSWDGSRDPPNDMLMILAPRSVAQRIASAR